MVNKLRVGDKCISLTRKPSLPPPPPLTTPILKRAATDANDNTGSTQTTATRFSCNIPTKLSKSELDATATLLSLQSTSMC